MFTSSGDPSLVHIDSYNFADFFGLTFRIIKLVSTTKEVDCNQLRVYQIETVLNIFLKLFGSGLSGVPRLVINIPTFS